MKKLSIIAAMMMALVTFTACDTDRDDNPILQKATTFELLKPAFGETAIDLLSSNTVTLKAKEQPNYGFPTQVNYAVQMALSDNFSNPENVYNIDYSTNALTLTPNAEDFNKGIMQLAGYDAADQVPANLDVYVRLSALLANDADSTTIVYSNVEKLKVIPYYIELKAAEPVFWWLIGGSIGDGSWTNNKSYDAYKSVFPMSLVPEFTYDAKTGLGEIQATIYLGEGGSAKLIQTISDWNNQWGMNDGAFVKNDGGSGNIAPTDGAGFYKIVYNTKDDKVTMTKVADPDKTYSSVSIIGLNGDWDTDIDMTPAAGAGENNHMWTAQITVTDATVFKMRADHDWGTNWGYGSYDGEVNKNGFATNNGKNIGINPGKYTIYLNDIDGYFYVAPFE